jgi:hypothetical protein
VKSIKGWKTPTGEWEVYRSQTEFVMEVKKNRRKRRRRRRRRIRENNIGNGLTVRN